MNRTGLLFGLAFGFLIVASGLSDYEAIHRMLLLEEFDFFFMLGSAVAVAMPLLWLFERRGWKTPLGGTLAIPRGPIERKHVLGAILFGIGWAVACTCPGPALAITVSGGLLGLVVMVGLVAGLLLRDHVQAHEAPTGPDTAPSTAPIQYLDAQPTGVLKGAETDHP